MSGWDNHDTAQRYDNYSKQYPMYRNTSRDLIGFAEIEAGMAVLDLACGTGITSQAVLQVLGNGGRLVAVDMATAMLEQAKQNIEASNVEFVQAAAEDLNNVITVSVDRVVCNSAFWQMKPDPAIEAVHAVLKEGGRFIFNLPDSFYQLLRPSENRGQDLNLRGKMREVAEQDYGFRFPQFKSIMSWTLDYNSVLQKLERAGFKLQHYEEVAYEQERAAAREFCAIPIMTERTLPGVDYETRLEILDKVCNQVDLTGTMTVYWAYFVAEKI